MSEILPQAPKDDPKRLFLVAPFRKHGSQAIRIPPAGLTFGRHFDNDVILDDPAISRFHGQLFWRSGSLWLRPVRSSQPIVFNNRELWRSDEEQEITAGEAFSSGGSNFRLTLSPLIEGASGSQEASHTATEEKLPAYSSVKVRTTLVSIDDRMLGGQAALTWREIAENLIPILGERQDWLSTVRIAGFLARKLKSSSCVIGAWNQGLWRIDAAFYGDGSAAQYPLSTSILGEAMRAGTSSLFDLENTEGGVPLASAESHGVTSAIVVPFEPGESGSDFIYLHAAKRRLFTEQDFNLAVICIKTALVAGTTARKSQQMLTTLGRFLPEDVLKLALNRPESLDPHEAAATVMFCDLAGYSALSEQVGPETTMLLQSEFQSYVGAIIHRHGGIDVQYLGDGVLAVWGLPFDQPLHALQACTAAEMILRESGRFRARMLELGIERALKFKIGLASGPVWGGVIGSARRRSFNVAGNTVNVASRMEGATRQLDVDCLVAESTLNHLKREAGCSALFRKLDRIRLKGIEQPLWVYELIVRDEAGGELIEPYEEVLDLFFRRSYREALSKAGGVLERFPDDLPSQRLLQRILDHSRGGAEDDLTARLETK